MQYPRVRRSAFVGHGGTGPQGQITAADRAAQEAEVATHHHEFSKALAAILDEVQRAYAGAGRSRFKQAKASGYDEAAYRGWLGRLGYAKAEP